MDSTQQIISGVYTLLRRLSQQKLAYLDVLERLNDVVRGYVQDMQLGAREQRTVVAEVVPERDDTDYSLRVPNVPDFEPRLLEFSPSYYAAGAERAWYEVRLVTFEAWPQHFSQPRPAAAIYGSSVVPDGVKIKFNLSEEAIANCLWRLSYRLPLLAVVQLGERAPIPPHFLPMLKVETALLCLPLVRDDSETWMKWQREIQPLYVAELAQWKARWAEYLRESVEPATQELRPFNHYRRAGARRGTRGYLPINAGGS